MAFGNLKLEMLRNAQPTTPRSWSRAYGKELGREPACVHFPRLKRILEVSCGRLRRDFLDPAGEESARPFRIL